MMQPDLVFDQTTTSRLAELMQAHQLIDGESIEIQSLSGGQSNPTYKIVAGHKRFILRKKPDGVLLPSAHAIEREYRVMHALQNTDVPVPKMGFLYEQPDVLGTPFYVMGFLDGRIRFDQTLPDFTVAERSALYNDMNRVMATLHTVDPTTIGLGDYGRPGNYFERQIARWSRQYLADPGERIPALESLIEVLPKHIPPGELHSIVHGDFRLDNLMIDPELPRVMGVLDWELSTLGHPVADFAYHCMSWHIPPSLWRGIGGLDLNALGIPTEDEYVDLYIQRTGFNDVKTHWHFYLAYNFFRISAILHGIGQRVRQGNAASADAIDMASKAEPLANMGWQFAQRLNPSV
jgi:aminoglycoside phosphotransferase (APT) family kinase protein